MRNYSTLSPSARQPTNQANQMKATRRRLTPEQKKALAKYEYALRQEDRYLGSVFVTPQGQRDIESKTATAFAACKALGMTYEHGL
jgi:cell division protein FtsN